MLKPHVLSALGFKLEEEGVVTPTVEAEVSASVEVTPEQQEAIDEAVTEIEEIATAGAEIEAETAQQEEVEEAEATLSAIADNLRTYGQLPQQMYDFLQKTGYLDVIAAAQSSAMNRVQYPAVESINPSALNRQVVDGIIAGCEGVLANAWQRTRDFLVSIWKKIVSFISRIIDFFMDYEKKAIRNHDRLVKYTGLTLAGAAKEIDKAAYPASGYTAEDIKKIGTVVEGMLSQASKASKDMNGTENPEQIANVSSMFAKLKTQLFEVASTKGKKTVTTDVTSKMGGKTTLKAAGFTAQNLTGEIWTVVNKCITASRSLKTMKSEAEAIAKRMDSGITEKKYALADDAGVGEKMKVYWNRFTDASNKYAQFLVKFQQVLATVIRSYVQASNAALAILDKEDTVANKAMSAKDAEKAQKELDDSKKKSSKK